MSLYLSIIIIILILVHVPTARAVPPPDFIFNVGSQIVQIFSFLVLGFSIVIGMFRKFFLTNPVFMKYGKVLWIVVAIVVITMSAGIAFYFDQVQHR